MLNICIRMNDKSKMVDDESIRLRASKIINAFKNKGTDEEFNNLLKLRDSYKIAKKISRN